MSTIAMEDARALRRRPAWLVMLSSRDGRFGFSLIVAMLALIILGPWLAPYAPTEIRLAPANQGPSIRHWLGTDHLGRDVLSRFLWGGRSIISIPLIAITITYMTGGLLSLVASYKGGWLDLVVARIFEFLMSLPSLLKILLLVAAFGPSTPGPDHRDRNFQHARIEPRRARGGAESGRRRLCAGRAGARRIGALGRDLRNPPEHPRADRGRFLAAHHLGNHLALHAELPRPRRAACRSPIGA